MTEKEKTSLSKFMSLILRHKPEVIGITLDTNGWVDTEALIDGMNRTGHSITLDNMKHIVSSCEKQRFKFSDDYSKIRANQGHSVSVDVELKETIPPDVLYHGTASRSIDLIKNDGLTPRSRLYVHLSSDAVTATKVGQRHGKPVVLTIGSGCMHRAGFKFYLSENNVWLTSSVPAEYINDWGE